MRRKKGVIVGVLAVIAVIALVAGGVWAYHHDRVMHAALMDLRAQNQADSVFTSDSAALALVSYYDHFWHHANDQMLAYYLLGRAYADMGEAPQAIEAYQTAVELADTTDKDCDFRVLRNVWGQMAEVFDAQNLPEDELNADSMFIQYSWLIGDTLEAINGYRALECPYFLLGKYDKILEVDSLSRCLFLGIGETAYAARALLSATNILAQRGESERVKENIDIIRREAEIFDEKGNLISGQEMFYYTLGLYFDSINQLDSSEFYYRRVLSVDELEAGYKGLLSVYSKRSIADSIAKFAPLYVDANDASHDSLRTAEVHKTASLYNYNRYKRQAEQEKVRKQQAQYAFLLISFICLTLLMVMFFLSKQHRKEKESMVTELQQAEKEMQTTKQEIKVLRQAAYKWEGKESLLAAREKKVIELQNQISYLKAKMLIPFDTDVNTESGKTDIIQHFHVISHLQIQRKGEQAKYLRPRAATEKEWKMLIAMIQFHYRRFYLLITTEHKLSNQEYKICILSRLKFEVSEISILLNTSMSSISNARKSIARKLFGLDSAIGLDIKLSEDTY